MHIGNCSKFFSTFTYLFFSYSPCEFIFIKVCQSGELELVQSILDELKTKSVDINVQDATQKTGLHHAVENNHELVVNFLLRNKANVNIPDANGDSAPHIAVMKGNIGIMKFLLEHGASLALMNNVGENSRSSIKRKYMSKWTQT